MRRCESLGRDCGVDQGLGKHVDGFCDVLVKRVLPSVRGYVNEATARLVPSVGCLSLVFDVR